MKKLAIISTHPIQYNSPLFKMLAQEESFEVKVFYTFSQREHDLYDASFGKTIVWDIPLLEGYAYTFVKNAAKKPNLSSFFGIHCPSLIEEVLAFKATQILVYGWNFKAHLQAMRYFKEKIPVWFRGDSTLLDYDIRNYKGALKSSNKKKAFFQLLKFKVRKQILTNVYKNIDIAFYVGTNNKDYFLEYGLKEQQLKLAPHAIDNARFFDSNEQQYEQKALAWKKKLGIKEDAFVFLFVGKFEVKKNPLLLIKAFLAAAIKNSKLVFVGNGALELELKEWSNNNSAIIFIPFQNQSSMPILYRLGDYTCLPSDGPGESWGLVLNESLACSRPFIASNKVGGALDLLTESSMMFKVGNLEALTKCLVRAAAIKYKINGKQLMQNLFDFNAFIKTIKTTIHDEN